MGKRIQMIAFDMDGTITQHKCPLGEENKKVLDRLAQRYRLLIVGAGSGSRIFRQMGGYPIDILANYGMQEWEYCQERGEMEVVRNISVRCDRESVDRRMDQLRRQFGYMNYAGESVEYHPSGCVTLPLLGTEADSREKLSFDPDRSRRRAIYPYVKELFLDYTVYVGGSSSFDLAPRPYSKYYALDRYCEERGLSHDQVVYAGDDYGPGGNDESIYRSDFTFYTIDDYRQLGTVLNEFLR